MTSKYIPNFLYKYTNCLSAINILKTSCIHLTNPQYFNDPYDANPPFIVENNVNVDKQKLLDFCDLQEIINGKNETITLARDFFETSEVNISPHRFYSSIMSGFLNKIRIICLSEENNNLLMWGHYADSYRGVVIEFNTNLLPFRLRQVAYQDEAKSIKGLYLDDFYLKNKETREEILSLYLVKSLQWQYEKEWRFVTDTSLLKDLQKNIKYEKYFCAYRDDGTFSKIKLSPGCISSVALGVNINIIDEYQIIEYTKKNFPRAVIFKTELNLENYKINFVKIY